MTGIDRPKVSVVICAFQDAKHIGRAVESVLGQTFADFELIVIDDGSMDGTRQAVATFDDPRITYHWQPHLGPSAALNNAISKARGEYVAFLSAEDECLPGRLKFQLASLECGGGNSHFCAPSLIDEDGAELGDHVAPVFFAHGAADEASAYRDFFKYGNFLCFSCAFVRREALERIKGFNLGLSQAHEFEQWVRLCKLGGMAISKERFVRYLVRRERPLPAGIRGGASSGFELVHIYEHFFDDVSTEFLEAGFPDEFRSWGSPLADDPQGFATILLLLHPNSHIREIALRRVLNMFRIQDRSASVMLSSFEITAPALATALRSHW